MHTYYFTFNNSHKHPTTGQPMQDYWVEVYAPSLGKAKTKFNEEYGGSWAMAVHEKVFGKFRSLYPQGQFARYEVDGCD